MSLRLFLAVVAVAGAGCKTPPSELPADPEMAAACIRAASCASTNPGVSSCLWRQESLPNNVFSFERVLWLNNFGFPTVACILQASDCATYEACVSGPDPDYCTRVPGGASLCNSDWAVSCVQSPNPATPNLWSTSSINCALEAGDACRLDGNGQATCAGGACSPDGAPTCQGANVVECKNGVQNVTDCSLTLGSQCSVDTTGAPHCGQFTGCTSDRCDHEDAVTCSNGLEIRLSCPTLRIPGSCRLNGTTAQCVPAAALSCDPTTHVDRCNGSALVYCDGQERLLDCTRLGFDGCQEGRCTHS